MNRNQRLLLLIALAAIPYINTLNHGFVYDDITWVVKNPAIRDLTQMREFFSGNEWFRPLPLLLFRLEFALAGLGPFLYHATNVLLHVLVTLMVWRVFRPSGDWTALLAAAFFAVLPVHTEAVANVTSSSELLAALFSLVAIALVHVPVAAGGSLLLALLSKENAVAVPFLVLLLWWRWRDLWSRRQIFAAFAAFSAAGAVYAVLRIAMAGLPRLRSDVIFGVVNPLAELPAVTRVANALMITAQNMALTLVPHHLSADYSFPQIQPALTLVEPRLMLWCLALAGGCALAYVLRRRQPDVTLGVAWFLIAVAPVANIFFPIGTIRAERLLYLPSVGVCLVLGVVLSELAKQRPRVAIALGVTLSIAYGAVTVRRNGVWANEDRFFTTMLADAPRSAKAHFEFGAYRARQRDCATAVPAFRRTLVLYADVPQALEGLTICLERLYQRCRDSGRWDCAARYLQQYLAIYPPATADAEAWVALGNAWMRNGAPREAEAAFRQSLARGAGAKAHANLAASLAAQQRYGEAAAEYAAAEAAGDNRPELYVDWAATLAHSGSPQQAAAVARRGMVRFPGSPELRRLLR